MQLASSLDYMTLLVVITLIDLYFLYQVRIYPHLLR
jgi:hypothetical protein